MINRRVFKSVALAALLSLSGAAVEAADFTLRLASTAAPSEDDPEYAALRVFQKEAENLSKGRIAVQIYPANQLGGTREYTEGVSLGSIEMGNTGYDTLGTFAPVANALTMPYLHDSLEHYAAVIDSPIGQKIHEQIAKTSGIRVLGVLYRGPRQLMTKNKEVRGPKDLSGLRIRSPETALNAETVRAMGGTPVPLSWSEVYTALATGAVDGVENPLDVLAAAKMQEVQKYLILTRHIYLGNPLIINDAYFQKLPEDMRKALVTAAKTASTSRIESLKTSEARSLKAMKDAGVIIVENPDLPSFAANARAVWAKFTDGKNITQDLLTQIKDFKP